MFFRIFQNEKTSFQALKARSSKSRKIDIFPWFWYKNGHFSNFLFKAIQARKMSFKIFLTEKTPFQAIKTRGTKSRKIHIFPKRLTHCFFPKMAIFPTCIFYAIQTRKMYSMILQNEKTSFQALKKRSSKSGKIDVFPKGLTHGCGPKMAISPTFFFRQYRPGKCLLRYS